MDKAKRLVALLLTAAMVFGFLPVDALRAAVAYAEEKATQARTWKIAPMEDALTEAEEQKAAGAVLTSGAWQYVVLPSTGYAAIVGHTDASAKALEVPAKLGRRDVVALAAGALSGFFGSVSDYFSR